MYKYLALCYIFPFLIQRRLSFLKTFLVYKLFYLSVEGILSRPLGPLAAGFGVVRRGHKVTEIRE